MTRYGHVEDPYARLGLGALLRQARTARRGARSFRLHGYADEAVVRDVRATDLRAAAHALARLAMPNDARYRTYDASILRDAAWIPKGTMIQGGQHKVQHPKTATERPLDAENVECERRGGASESNNHVGLPPRFAARSPNVAPPAGNASGRVP